MLLLDEVESIDTDDPVLESYLVLQRAMLSDHGHTLELGARLHASLGGQGYRATAECRPPVPIAARMLAMNLPTWRDDPAVAAPTTPPELDELAEGLAVRARPADLATSIAWQMRQIAL